MKNCTFLGVLGFFGLACENLKTHSREKYKPMFTEGACL